MSTESSTSVDFPGIDEHGDPIVVPHYPVAEAARRLHVSRKMLRTYCRTGRWPYLPIGNRIYMSDADMAEALRRERDRAIRDSQQPVGIRGVVVPFDDDDQLSLLDELDDDEGVQ